MNPAPADDRLLDATAPEGPRRALSRAPAVVVTQTGTAEESLLAFTSEGEKSPEPHRQAVRSAPLVPAAAMDRRIWLLGAVLAVVALVAAIVWPLRASAGRAQTPEFGKLSLNTQPVGATVFIDGVNRGATPFATALSPGSHTVVVRQGDQDRTIPLTVAAGEQVSQFFEFAKLPPPAPPTGTLSITTDRTGTRVLVDGKAAGASPLLLAGLTPGEHVVSVATDSGTLERRVKVEGGTTTAVVFSAPQATTTAGWLAVSAPFEVQIFQDTELVGSSAAPKIMVPAGKHDVRFVNASLGFDETRRVDVAAGKTNAVRIAPPNAAVSINARPWADVIVDGSPVGQTPLANISLSIGTHQVIFRHPQLGERRQSAVITVAGPNRITADLTKQ